MMQKAILDSREVLGAILCFAFVGNSAVWSHAVDTTASSPPAAKGSLPEDQTDGALPTRERAESKSDARETIRKSLRGEPFQTPRDGVLQDVLGVIANRGSILDNSELESNEDRGREHPGNCSGELDQQATRAMDRPPQAPRRFVDSSEPMADFGTRPPGGGVSPDRAGESGRLGSAPRDRKQFRGAANSAHAEMPFRHPPLASGVHPATFPYPARRIAAESAETAEILLKAARLLSEVPGSQNDPLIFQLRSKASELLSR